MPRYDVFVSYNRKDQAYAERLAEALRTMGLTVFFDRAVQEEGSLLPGSRWRKELGEAIRDSWAVAVLLGRAGMGRTQELEEEMALAEKERRDILTFRVILPGGKASDEPSIAGLNTFVDLRQGIENRDELVRIRLAIEQIAPKPVEPSSSPAPMDEDTGAARQKAIDDAVDAIVRRLSTSGLTFFLGSGVSLPPSTFDMAVRITERLRENDPDLPMVPLLDVAGLYYAVDRDDELAVEMEIHDLLQQVGPQLQQSVHLKLARLVRLVQERLRGRAQAAPHGDAALHGDPFRQVAKPLLIVTTNFDLFMERALIRAGVGFRRIVQFGSEARLHVTEYATSLDGANIRVEVRDHTGAVVRQDFFGEHDLEKLDSCIKHPTKPVLFDPGSRTKKSKNPLTALPISGSQSEAGAQIVLYKPYGSQELSGSCAISSEHHYRFALRSVPDGFVPKQIIETIGNTPVVVLGYNFFDPGYRLANHTLLANRVTTAKMYVVRPRPMDTAFDSRIESALWGDVKRAWSKTATLLDVPEQDFLDTLSTKVTRDL